MMALDCGLSPHSLRQGQDGVDGASGPPSKQGSHSPHRPIPDVGSQLRTLAGGGASLRPPARKCVGSAPWASTPRQANGPQGTAFVLWVRRAWQPRCLSLPGASFGFGTGSSQGLVTGPLQGHSAPVLQARPFLGMCGPTLWPLARSPDPELLPICSLLSVSQRF